MKKVAPFALALVGFAAFAQSTVRVRGTIARLDGDVLTVKSRDGKEVRVQLAPDAQVAVAKATTLGDIKPGTYVGSAAMKRADGKLVAKEVHTIPPQVPAGHMPWDLEPGSTMTNANLEGVAQAAVLARAERVVAVESDLHAFLVLLADEAGQLDGQRGG